MDMGVVGLGTLVVVVEVALVILVPAAIIALGIRLAGIRPSRTPADILRERLARGEITKDEFDALMRAIGS